jgi:hypothetical protein
MAKVKSYMNPNIPKPKPGKDNPDARVKIPRQPRPGPLTPRTPGAPGKREKRPLPKPKPGTRSIKDGLVSIFDRKQRQLPTRVKPEGRRQKSSDMGKTARNGRTKPGTRGR